MLKRWHGRVAWVALGALAGLLGSRATPAESPSPATFVPLSGSIVRVEAEREHGGLSVGTGITIAPSIVVTNCHVTRDATVARISGSGMLWDVSGEFADLLHDVCFLRIPGWRGKPVVLGATDHLRLGQQVVALGFTGGAGIALTSGHVLALHALDAAHVVVESDTAFTSGASGGGLFDDAGELVGLLTFRLRGSTGSFYSVPVEWIREGMPGENQWTEIAPLHGERAFWQADTAALPYFMQAPPLDADGQWGALLVLADRWVAASPQDAEALLVRGKALQMLNRPQAAVAAFVAALRLSPGDPIAWYGLALCYAALGDTVALHAAEAKLGTLSESRAAALKARLATMRDAD
jgi:serine protease Do